MKKATAGFTVGGAPSPDLLGWAKVSWPFRPLYDFIIVRFFLIYSLFKLPVPWPKLAEGGKVVPLYIGANLRILVEMAKWRGGSKTVSAGEGWR